MFTNLNTFRYFWFESFTLLTKTCPCVNPIEFLTDWNDFKSNDVKELYTILLNRG